MKKLIPLLAVLMLLTGCAPEPTTDSESSLTETDAPASTEIASTEASVPVQTIPPTVEPPAETLSLYETYRALLEELLQDHEETSEPTETDPTESDTTESDTTATDETTESVSTESAPAESGRPEQEQQFALLDIDNDGREELLVRFADRLTVYDGDRAVLRTGLDVIFYDNGTAESPVSEAEGDFAPYIMYQYDAESDAYYEVAYVGRLDRAAMEEAGLGDEFPEEADTSGSGYVYLIGNDNPVDITEYELWRSSWAEGTEVTEIPFVPLTPETAAAIG